MQATKATADRESCLKNEKRISSLVTFRESQQEKSQPGWVSERTTAFLALFTVVPMAALAASPLRFQVSLRVCNALTAQKFLFSTRSHTD
jgi:hypothetical protein